jgi:hypothetical protein
MVTNKYFLASCVAILLACHAHAQRLLGVATGNWSGTSSIYLDPSSIVDSRANIVVDLVTVNGFIDNNLGSVALNKISTFNDAFTFSNNAQFNILAFAEVRGPGVMYSINEANAVAFTTRLRVFNQFNNFDRKLFQTLTNPLYAGGNYSLTSSNFNWTANVWSELNLTYARVLYKDNEQFLKAGITAGRTGGIGYMGIKGAHLDASYDPGTKTLQANNSDIEFATNVINDATKLENGVSNVFGQIFGQGGGSGFRGDVGITYEYRSGNDDDYFEQFDETANKYKTRLSLAVTDIGAITYKDDLRVNIKGNGTLTEKGLTGNFSDANKFTNYINSQGFRIDTPRTNVTVSLPTALVFGIDYHVWKHAYVNGALISNLASRLNFGNSYYGQFSVVPRWDTRIVTVALPLTYSSMTQGMKVGFGLRVWGYFVGSDDIALLLGGKHYGVNFYTGLFVPIHKKYKEKVFGR